MTKALERMKSGEGIGGASLGPMAPHGSISDPMSRVDARLDREDAWSIRIDADRKIIHDAMVLLYGEDALSGLAAALGSEYAFMLRLRYLEHRAFETVAIVSKCSRSTVKRKMRVAFEFIDSNGFDATASGVNTLSGQH